MLTERHEAILDFIREYQRRESVPPSSRIIQSRFRFKSQTSVVRSLMHLAGKSLVEQLADGRWGLKTGSVQGHLFEVPVMGDIPAGLPASWESEAAGKISIDPAVFGIRNPQGGRFFALRVRGDSMIGLHIVPGDLVLCEWREPRVGEVIAALVDETTVTLKKLVRERGRLILRAAHLDYPDLKPDRLEAQGVVRGLIRSAIALNG